MGRSITRPGRLGTRERRSTSPKANAGFVQSEKQSTRVGARRIGADTGGSQCGRGANIGAVSLGICGIYENECHYAEGDNRTRKTLA